MTTTDAAKAYFQYINFSGVAGPNSLSGIRTSHIVPSYTYNTVNHPISPTAGRSLFISTDFAGSILGGNINTIRPSIDVKYFKQAPWHKSHILAFHALGSLITGYGGKFIAPFSRTYIGGEQDVRGFEIWGITPDRLCRLQRERQRVERRWQPARTQKVIQNGVVTSAPVTMSVPSYQLITPGGDTQVVTNFEYRIPIVGPVTLALFGDAGMNRILRPSQLTMEPSRVNDLNNQFPQAGFRRPRADRSGYAKDPRFPPGSNCR